MEKYSVIVRPFYREHEPMVRTVSAENEEKASDMVFGNRDVKEILDVMLATTLNWNDKVKEKYWRMYADEEIIKRNKKQ